MSENKLIKSIRGSLLCASLLSSSAYALPDPTVDISGLTNKISTEGVGAIIGDSKNRNTVYVKPTTMKFNGKAEDHNMAMAGICQELHEMRILTYRFPTEEEFPYAIKNSAFYSPAFESSLGVTARNVSKVNDILEVKQQVKDYLDLHAEEYGNYISSKSEFDLSSNEVERQKTTIENLKNDFTTRMLAASENDDREQIKKDFRTDLIVEQKKLSKILSQKSKFSASYHDSLQSWAPYRDKLEWLDKVENSLTMSYERLQNISDKSLQRSEKLIQALETRVVAEANASFSLNADKERNLLNERIREAGLSGWNIQELPVFNVRINPGVTRTYQSSKSEDRYGVSYEFETYNFPSVTRQVVTSSDESELKKVEFPYSVEQADGNPESVSIMVADLKNGFGGSQTFKLPVTLGAVCGYPKQEEKRYEYTDEEGRNISRTVTVSDYSTPQTDRPVMVQNVALRYNYYQKAEPISGSCSMDVDKASSYWRSAGSSSSWSWFKKTTTTWDNTKKTFKNNMNLTCSLTKSPVGNNPEESAKLNQVFERALYQDMFSMFLMTYAKDYTVKVMKPTVLDSDSKLFSRIGEGVLNLCGGMYGCQIAGIVLKSLDELVGARHSGVTSNSTETTGKLRRNLALQTYLVSEGHTNIEMRVCLDSKKCEE